MGKNIKLPLEAGFTALCNHIKAIKATAEQSGSAVAGLAESTAASLEEIDGLFDTKQDKTKAVSISIPADGWGTDAGAAYPRYYDIAVKGVTAKDRADVTISPGSVAVATSCGLCPTTETLAGKIRLRAASQPTAPISAEYWLFGGKE